MVGKNGFGELLGQKMSVAEVVEPSAAWGLVPPGFRAGQVRFHQRGSIFRSQGSRRIKLRQLAIQKTTLPGEQALTAHRRQRYSSQKDQRATHESASTA